MVKKKVKHSEKITFEDCFPIKKTTKYAAATGLYAMLHLASQNVIQVLQDDGGVIYITIKKYKSHIDN